MAEMILPGVYIEVRPEGLIVPGRVTVGNLGVVGTAGKGPISVPVILGSYTEARERFGGYDPWIDGKSDELTLVRALELAYAHGATTVFCAWRSKPRRRLTTCPLLLTPGASRPTTGYCTSTTIRTPTVPRA